MSKTGDLYLMMRLSYEQAADDYNSKKSLALVGSYKNIIRKMLV